MLGAVGMLEHNGILICSCDSTIEQEYIHRWKKEYLLDIWLLLGTVNTMYVQDLGMKLLIYEDVPLQRSCREGMGTYVSPSSLEQLENLVIGDILRSKALPCLLAWYTRNYFGSHTGFVKGSLGLLNISLAKPLCLDVSYKRSLPWEILGIVQWSLSAIFVVFYFLSLWLEVMKYCLNTFVCTKSKRPIPIKWSIITIN